MVDNRSIVVFFLLTSVFVGCDAKRRASSSRVVELTPCNFKAEVLESDGVVLVAFFAPCSADSQALKPVWEKVATVLRGAATVAALDVHAHKSIAQKYYLGGIPAVKAFSPGKPPVEYESRWAAKTRDYEREWNVRNIANFAHGQIVKMLNERLSGNSTGKPRTGELVDLTPQYFSELVMQSKQLWIVVFSAPLSDASLHWWNMVAKKLQGKMKLGHVDCHAFKALKSRFNVEQLPTILVFGADKHRPVPYVGSMASIVSFALKKLTTYPAEVVEQSNPDVMEEKCAPAAIGAPWTTCLPLKTSLYWYKDQHCHSSTDSPRCFDLDFKTVLEKTS